MLEIVVNRTARKDDDENQTTNINYDENLILYLKKTNKIKLASDKT